VAAYIGGTQLFTFESPKFFYLKAKVKFFPLWVDLFRNELIFKPDDLTFCDSLWYGLYFMAASIDFDVGLKTCSTGMYDRWLADEDDKVNSTCGYEYTYFPGIMKTALLGREYSFLNGTCKEPKAYKEEEHTVWIEWPFDDEEEEVVEEEVEAEDKEEMSAQEPEVEDVAEATEEPQDDPVAVELASVKAELEAMKKQAAEGGLKHAAPTANVEPVNLKNLSTSERVSALLNQFS